MAKTEEEDFAFKYILDKDGNSQMEEVEIETKGYELLQDDTIRCADCGAKLVTIIKVLESDLSKCVKAQCPCGGESYLYEITGQTYMQAIDGMAVEDMVTDINDGVMHITIKVIKNG